MIICVIGTFFVLILWLIAIVIFFETIGQASTRDDWD